MQNSNKNLDFYYFVTHFDFLSLKNDVNVPSKSIKHINLFAKNLFFVGILNVNDENRRIRIQDPDPDPLVRSMDPPHQNVLNPQHWMKVKFKTC
jgi:hypothetical protein